MKLQYKVPARMKTCYLHIGTRKTGSSSIQSFLNRNRKSLRKRRILKPKAITHNGFEIALASDRQRNKQWFYFEQEKITTGEEWLTYRLEFKKKLYKEVRRSRCRKIVISSEDLSHFTQEDEVRDVFALLDFFDEVKVIVYLRRQDEYAVSDLTSTVLNGGLPFTLCEDLAHQMSQLNYSHLLNAWSKVFGRENLVVRLFDRKVLVNGDLIDDFCSHIGIDLQDLERPETENSSISYVGSRFMQRVNEVIPRFERNGIHRYIQKVCPGQHHFTTRAQAQEFYRCFEDSNTEIAHRFFDGKKPFDEDFSKYPEKIEEISTSFEDAVDVAIGIWKELQKEGKV